jgi:hypothetical protein
MKMLYKLLSLLAITAVANHAGDLHTNMPLPVTTYQNELQNVALFDDIAVDWYATTSGERTAAKAVSALPICDLSAFSPPLKSINGEYMGCINQFFQWWNVPYRISDGAYGCNPRLQGRCNTLTKTESVRDFIYYNRIGIYDSKMRPFPFHTCIPTTCDLP